jgi:flagellar biosynthesis protein FliQ
MTPEYVVALLGRMLHLALVLSAPLLGVGLVIGVVVALLQAVTQVHEASLAFVPKAIALGALLLYLGPWFVQQMSGFTQQMTQEMSQVARRNR